MATKLKNMKLTSVDLVRAGANQEADICLYKSAEPPEAIERPSEQEEGLIRRFINWLKENPSEAEETASIDKEDPHEDIKEDNPQTFEETENEKASDETLDFYLDSLEDSIKSIQLDDSLDSGEKSEIMLESLHQFTTAMEKLVPELCTPNNKESNEVSKFNPYHGAHGLFTTASGATSMTFKPGQGKMYDNAIAREKQRTASGGSSSSSGGSASGSSKKKEPKITRDNYGFRSTTDVDSYDGEDLKNAKSQMEKYGKVYVLPSGTPMKVKDVEWMLDGATDHDDARAEMRAEGEIVRREAKKSIDIITEVEKGYPRHDVIEEVKKYNTVHGPDGRFASSPGGATGGISSSTMANGGMTIHAKTGKQPKTGYMVGAYGDRSKWLQGDTVTDPKKRTEAIKQFMKDNEDLLSQPDNYLGTWFDTETGSISLDISKRYENKDEAIKFATEHNEKAIFDLGNLEEISTGGTGNNWDN